MSKKNDSVCISNVLVLTVLINNNITNFILG